MLTFPFSWRARLAHDGALLSTLTRLFVDTVSALYTSRIGDDAKTGALTVVQGTSSELRLNPHLYASSSTARTASGTASSCGASCPGSRKYGAPRLDV